MPNHVTNIIQCSGDERRINEMLQAIQNDQFGPGSISFNKIIPMPDYVFTGLVGEAERRLYGKNNWYDWSIENWDTKWDAYGFECIIPGENDTIWCQTAWSAPHKVISRLAEMYPDIRFQHEWADEDIGSNCGRKIYENGRCFSEWYPETESEGVAFALGVLGIDMEPSEIENTGGTLVIL